MEDKKKLEVEFKQTIKGSWYVGSLKVGADTVEELDQVIGSTVTFLDTKIDQMNKGDFKPAMPAAIKLNYDENKLFEKLRSMRMDLARAENIPPYMVAHDSVLKRLVQVKPMTKEEMIEVEGIGERNFEKYGIYFLKVIRSSCVGAENGR